MYVYRHHNSDDTKFDLMDYSKTKNLGFIMTDGENIISLGKYLDKDLIDSLDIQFNQK